MSLPITVAGVAYTVPSSAADTQWAAQQVQFEQALALAASNGTWTAITPLNSWANSGQPLQSRMNSQGDVDVRGLLNSGSSGTVFGTLPAGQKPQHSLSFNVGNSGGTARLTISASTGNMTITDLTGSSNTFFDCGSIRFSIL